MILMSFRRVYVWRTWCLSNSVIRSMGSKSSTFLAACIVIDQLVQYTARNVTIYTCIICFARKSYIISTERLFAVKCLVRAVMLLSYILFNWLSMILFQPNIDSKIKYPGRLYIKVNNVTFTDTCHIWISSRFWSCNNCNKRNNPLKD